MTAVPALLTLALLGASAGCARKHVPTHESPGGPQQHHHVTTQDGWQLELSHVEASGATRHKTPLLLVHGLGSNHFSLDFAPKGSLARYLSRQGWDVWMVDLRGHGCSLQPRVFGKPDFDWNFDSYVRFDAPAAVDYVRKTTGAEHVFWLGHSMGGMIGYAYLGTGGTGVKGFVPIASPTSFQIHRLGERTIALSPLFSWLPSIHFSMFGALMYVFSSDTPDAVDWWVWNSKNMTMEEKRLIAKWAGDRVVRDELKQFRSWMETGSFRSADGGVDYQAALATIRVPGLFLGGALDQLVPPERVMTAFLNYGATDKTLRIFGRANGYENDYGHVDLACGLQAETDVFPAIDAWLAYHDIEQTGDVPPVTATDGVQPK